MVEHLSSRWPGRLVAYFFQRRQKLAEAAMAERIRQITLFIPLLNRIFSCPPGAWLPRPEGILQAKRKAVRISCDFLGRSWYAPEGGD